MSNKDVRQVTSYAIHTSIGRVTERIKREVSQRGYSTFRTLDNGGHPFRLKLYPDSIQLRDNSNEKDEDGEANPREDRFTGFSVDIKRASEIWIGTGAGPDVTDLTYPHYFGSSAIIVVPSMFRLSKKPRGDLIIVVSSDVSVFSLTPGESVVRFVSTVGNSAVPYGWIETTKGKYFIESFNCASGFVPLSMRVESPFCIEDSQPGLQKIKNLKVMIPGL